jgi:hypothetical protein
MKKFILAIMMLSSFINADLQPLPLRDYVEAGEPNAYDSGFIERQVSLDQESKPSKKVNIIDNTKPSLTQRAKASFSRVIDRTKQIGANAKEKIVSGFGKTRNYIKEGYKNTKSALSNFWTRIKSWFGSKQQ